MAYPLKLALHERVYTAYHADVTVAAASGYAVMGGRGAVIKVQTVITGAIGTAAETLTVTKNGTATTYTITIEDTSSAAGDVDSVDIPEGSLTVEAGDVLTLVSANDSSGTVPAAVNYIVRET